MINRRREILDRVEFRWRQHEEEFPRRLAEEAENAGRSQSDHARELLKNALTASDLLQHAIETLHEEVTQLHEQLRVLASIKEGIRTVHENIYEFRDDLASCVTKVLTDAGRLDAKAAANWVRTALKTE